MTRYLGIDPGYAALGYGVLDDSGDRLALLDSGVIKTPADMPLELRLETVRFGVIRIVRAFDINVLGVEHPVHGPNVTNSVGVGAAFGAVLLAGVEVVVPILLHFPTQVKAAVANGGASKQEVRRGVEIILGIKVSGRDDIPDAIACAICTRDVWQLSEMVREVDEKSPG